MSNKKKFFKIAIDSPAAAGAGTLAKAISKHAAIVHAECARYNFEYNHILNSWKCLECADINNKRYNPFALASCEKYDPVQMQESDDISELSKMLEDCQTYNYENFSKVLSEKVDIKINLSALFNNIDGNQSNFDNFVCNISQYSHNFSFIGISETNISPCHKDLYQIPGYISEYNAKNVDKNKGSGIALYIKDNYTFTRMEQFCKCSKNLECLFVEITNTSQPLYIGVVYRPPSGLKSVALNEFDSLMMNFPK